MAMSIGKVNENNEESSNSGQNSFQINLDVLIPSLMHIKDPIAWSQISVFIPYFLPWFVGSVDQASMGDQTLPWFQESRPSSSMSVRGRTPAVCLWFSFTPQVLPH